MRLKGIILLVLIMLVKLTFGQTPSIVFLKDSAFLGDEIELLLVYAHPPEIEVVFPDSSSDFVPFEYVRKNLFYTRTKDSISVDSAIYVLQTFELDKVQNLRLAITLLTTKDSISIFSNLDTVFLKEVIEELPDTLRLIENSSQLNVDKQFNYPYLLITLSVIGVICLVGFLLFGKTLWDRYLIYTWKKKHQVFLQNFESLTMENKDLELILTFWKNHMTWVEGEEINAMTTREMNEFYINNELHELMISFDKIIYGGQESNMDFSMLKLFSDERLKLKISKKTSK